MIAAMLACVVVVAQEDNKPPAGFTALFDGKTLVGWHARGGDLTHVKLRGMSEEERKKTIDAQTQDAMKHWKAESGEIVNDGHGAYLTTDRDFGDYEFWIDYKTVAKADSGIYLRGCPQVQIWDFTEAGGKWNIGADKGSGGLWNNSKGAPGKDPLVLADKPFGEWNRFRIIQIGQRTTVYLNGKLLVDQAIMENLWEQKEGKPLPLKGPIQLQTHGGEIRWRNVFVREIPAEEANAALSKRDEAGFEPVFNGKDLTGWIGAVDNYEVREGAIACKAGKGGNLVTKEEYGDFVVKLEIRIPEGGNNGLAIRCPPDGDAAYSAMCELQVLDTEHPKYAKIDPRQAHGSAYAMVPAHRGYLRPAGQWNYQEVTVKGSTLRVELNGNVILNTDLSTVKEFMGGKPHPGIGRTKGHFGFAGHSDPVMFRNLRIRKM